MVPVYVVLCVQDTASAAIIAATSNSWLKVGARYVQKDNPAIYEFVGMDNVDGIFKLADAWGTDYTLRIPHKDLRNMRATDKKVPALHSAEHVARRRVDSFMTLEEEVAKATALTMLFNFYSELLGIMSRVIECASLHAEVACVIVVYV